jgi:hypothetical protein
VTSEIAARLKNYHIQTMTEGMYFSIFFRDGCLAMVPVSEDGVGYSGIGSSGLSTDDGLLYLVWREQQPMLVGHSVERAALPEQVEMILHFSADLKAALGLE